MLSFSNTITQTKEILADLIQCSLAVDFNFPSSRTKNDNIESIDFGKRDISIVLDNNKTYNEIYDTLNESRSFICKLIDGALVQLMYEFKNDMIIKHRLAFFSSPHLESFQNNPEDYEGEVLYSDVLAKNIVAFPIRFDYDSRQECCKDIIHPASHLTLGQYVNCRIPVSSPVSPSQFFDFILRNFYNTAFNKHRSKIRFSISSFENTITESDLKVTHLNIT